MSSAVAKTSESKQAKVKVVPDGAGRRIWELEESVAELTARAAESVERERVQTLEIAALRRDLDVKAAYNVMLERASLERKEHVAWLEATLDEERRTRELATQRAEQAERALQRVHQELCAERARRSYRLMQAMIARLASRPILSRIVRASRSSH